jgi:hypothetical protein
MKGLLVDGEDRYLRGAKQGGIVERADFQNRRGQGRREAKSGVRHPIIGGEGPTAVTPSVTSPRCGEFRGRIGPEFPRGHVRPGHAYEPPETCRQFDGYQHSSRRSLPS